MIRCQRHINIATFTNRFSSIHRFNDSKFSCTFLNQSRNSENVFCSFFGRHFSPNIFVCISGSSYRFVNISLGCFCNASNHLFSARIYCFKIAAFFRFYPNSIDKQLILLLQTNMTRRFRCWCKCQFGCKIQGKFFSRFRVFM